VTTTSRRRPFDQHAETHSSPLPGDAFSPTAAREPRQLAYDDIRCRIGEVMDRITTPRGEILWLRPRHGGQEWEADACDVRLLDQDPAGQP
jgi:hypothetical protein